MFKRSFQKTVIMIPQKNFIQNFVQRNLFKFSNQINNLNFANKSLYNWNSRYFSENNNNNSEFSNIYTWVTDFSASKNKLYLTSGISAFSGALTLFF